MARFWSGIAARRDLRVDAEIYRKRHAGLYLRCGRAAVACILALALCAVGLAGCTEDEGPLAKDEGSANASTSEEYVLASSYDEIYQAVCASLDEDEDAASADTETLATQLALTQAYDELSDESSDSENALNDEDIVAELVSSSWDLSILATPQNALSTAELSDIVTVEDESGYIYVVAEGTLSVLYADGSSAERVAQLSMSAYDELERWESVSALYLEGDTLAVVGSLSEDTDWDPDAPDYALSAYAGARVMVAFFDVSDPSEPEYLSALGVTGTLLGFEESDGVLTVVASRSAVPAVSSDTGAWLVEDEEEDAEVDTDAEDSDDATTTTSSALPTRQEVADRLELRRNDAVSYVPAVYQDGALTPVAADRVYLPADGSGAIATVVATFDLEAQTVDSAFAVYSDELEVPTLTMGEGVAYLQWESAQLDEETAQVSSSTLIMSVALQGSSLSGISAIERVEGSTGSADSSLSYIYGDTLYRLVRSDLKVDDQKISGSWILQALDEELNVLEELEIETSGEPLGSVLFAQGCAYLVSGQEQYTLTVADLSDPANISLSNEGDASAWPEVFLQLEDGTLLGYGNQASRAEYDEEWALLMGGSTADARAEDADILRVVTLSSDGVSLGDAVALGSSEDYLASALLTTPLQSANVAGDLVGMVVNEGSDAAVYRVYRFSDDSLELVGEIALADDADAESDGDTEAEEDAETTSDEGLSDATKYRGAHLFVLDDYAYVMSFEADFATVYVCDASTLEVLAEVSLEDEVVLSEE